MILYSVEYTEGRSKTPKRKWFGTEREADDWVHSTETMKTCRNVVGPNKHRIEGKRGLLSFLQTYREDGE